jgi:hypothetical protein
VVFIKTKMLPPLKLCPKLNIMSRQHQSNVTTCHIINFLKKLKIILKNK